MKQGKYGYFDTEHREYVITQADTPSPWVNYLMGKNLNAMISQSGGGVAFYKEPSQGRLTRYRFNGLPTDSPGFFLYIQDGETIWSPSGKPACTPLDSFECRHGLGYTKFLACKDGIEAAVMYTIPTRDDIMLWSVELTNRTNKTKKLKLSTYIEFSSHDFVKDTLYYNSAERQWRITFDKKFNGIKVDHCVFEAIFQGQCIFASTENVVAYDTNRDVFIGHGRTEANPVGLIDGPYNTNLPGGSAFACGVLQNEITLKPGQSKHVLFRYAVSDNFAESARLLEKYTTKEDANKAVAQQKAHWEQSVLTAQANTPDMDFNEMINTWLPYTIQATFRFDRSISTRHTGSTGSLRYRDSMQDAMPASQLFPNQVKERLLLIFHTMFANGRTLYAVNPETLKPPNERAEKVIRCDAGVWGVYTIFEYLTESGDMAFLDEVVPYYDKGEGSVFEHLCLSLRFIEKNVGKDGLPKLFTCDWNDNLEVLTDDYTGCQSVMVAEQYIVAARLLIEICEKLRNKSEIMRLRKGIKHFTEVLNSKVCWDGAWYKRVLGDNIVLGSKKCREGKIFLNTQSWATIAGTLDKKKTDMAMESVWKKLYTDRGLRIYRPSMTLMPDGKSRYVAGLPGCGENGGIFYHANTWAIIAETLRGNGDRAWEYFCNILPPKVSVHDADRFAEAPYAFVSWVYGPDHPFYGKGQYSWITGGTAWIYITGLQYILGIKPTLDGLAINPCIPSVWPGYSIQRKWQGTTFDITVSNPHGLCKGNVKLKVDGKSLEGNVLPSMKKKRVKVEAVIHMDN